MRTGVLTHGDQVVGTYALWEDINEAIRPILVRFGFALSFRVSQEVDSITVTAVLMHSGGHMESTDLRLPPDATGGEEQRPGGGLQRLLRQAVRCHGHLEPHLPRRR